MKLNLLSYIIILTLNLLTYSLILEGEIKNDVILSSKNNPVIVKSNIEIPDSLSLKINKGTVLKFDGYYHILVRGTLEANGSTNEPVIFTSNKNDPNPEDWNGIIFYDKKSSGYLKNCIVKYAFKNYIWKTNPIIKDCAFENNNYAIYCSYSKSIKILNNKIKNNRFGIYSDYSSPIIKDNTVINNQYGIYCIFSSSPVVGENIIKSNYKKNIYLDDSMGKNKAENINNHVWDLMKDIF